MQVGPNDIDMQDGGAGACKCRFMQVQVEVQVECKYKCGMLYKHCCGMTALGISLISTKKVWNCRIMNFSEIFRILKF